MKNLNKIKYIENFHGNDIYNRKQKLRKGNRLNLLIMDYIKYNIEKRKSLKNKPYFRKINELYNPNDSGIIYNNNTNIFKDYNIHVINQRNNFPLNHDKLSLSLNSSTKKKNNNCSIKIHSWKKLNKLVNNKRQKINANNILNQINNILNINESIEDYKTYTEDISNSSKKSSLIKDRLRILNSKNIYQLKNEIKNTELYKKKFEKIIDIIKAQKVKKVSVKKNLNSIAKDTLLINHFPNNNISLINKENKYNTLSLSEKYDNKNNMGDLTIKNISNVLDFKNNFVNKGRNKIKRILISRKAMKFKDNESFLSETLRKGIMEHCPVIYRSYMTKKDKNINDDIKGIL